MSAAYLPQLVGGMLIGAAAGALMLLTGRIAGVSGIAGRLVQGEHAVGNAVFLIGLTLGPVIYLGLAGRWPDQTMITSGPTLVIAGLLVGFGARMGSGCTSGHGVIGLARLSRRSAAAVATFVGAGVVTVTCVRVLL